MCLKARGFPAVAVGSPQLAASAVVRCGRLQRTLNDGQADRRGQLPWRESVGDWNVCGDPGAVSRNDSRLTRHSAVTAGRTDCERQARRDSVRVNTSWSY